MTARTVTFQGTTYAERPSPTLPVGSYVTVESLMGPVLVELYNLVSANLDQGRVKRFADNKSGAKRTWAKLIEWADLPDVLDTAAVQAKAPPPALGHSDFAMGGKATPAMEAKIKARREAKEANKPVTPEETAGQMARRLTGADKSAPVAKSDQLLRAAAIDGERTRLRNNPPASDNPAKDAEMPALRKSVKPLKLDPKAKVYPRRTGSKQAVLVDLLSRPEGATFGELYDGLAAAGKPWKGVTIRSGLAWDMNHVTGYGISTELLNGEEFAKQGRAYEAKRLGMTVIADNGVQPLWSKGTGYDPEVRLGVYRLTYPKGMDAPLPHNGKKA